MSARRGRELPPPQPGRFGGAILSSYMWGFWVGLFVCLGRELQGEGAAYLMTTLGVQSKGWANFWLWILFFVAISQVGRASVEYYRFTGRTFLEDRIGFAKAGGQDIGMFSGLLAVGSVFLVFATVVPTFVASWIRLPTVLVSSFLIGRLVAGFLSRRVYATLFGSPLQP